MSFDMARSFGLARRFSRCFGRRWEQDPVPPLPCLPVARRERGDPGDPPPW